MSEGPSKKGPHKGVTVTTVRRPVPRASQGSTTSKGKRRSRPSVRYREKMGGTATPGGDFCTDDEVGKMLDDRILEIYDPTTNINNVSVRRIPLRLQAYRDGENFRLPRLTTICLDIASQHFLTHILPLNSTKEPNTSFFQSKKRPPRKRRGLLGLVVPDEDSQDSDGDFTASSSDSDRGGVRMGSKKRLRQGPRGTDTSGNALHTDDIQNQHKYNTELLLMLSPALTLALQRHLEAKSPQVLTPEVLSKYFASKENVTAGFNLRASAVKYGVSTTELVSMIRNLYTEEASRSLRKVISPRPNTATTLRTLHLQAFTDLTSAQLVPFFTETKSLESVCLRGCLNVTAEAVEQLVKSCGKTLRSINLNWTSVGLKGFEELACNAPNLEVLKLAYVKNLTDATVQPILSRATEMLVDAIPFSKLKKLKVRGTDVDTSAVLSLLKHCGPHIQNLDISRTKFGGQGCMTFLLFVLGVRKDTQDNKHLEKISFSDLSISNANLKHFAEALPHLQAIKKMNFSNLRSIPTGFGRNDLDHGVSADFAELLLANMSTKAALHGPKLEKEGYTYEYLSLANKYSPDMLDPHLIGVRPFSISEEGDDTPKANPRGIRVLDLTGWKMAPKRFSMAPMMGSRRKSWTEPQNRGVIYETILGCEDLTLSHCGVRDEWALEVLTSHGQLRRLNLAYVQVAQEEINNVIESNPFLEELDLTGCRYIPIRERRNYLEVYQARRCG